MKHSSADSATPDHSTSLFVENTSWARSLVLEAKAIGTCNFDLDEFARYREIRILTYSSSVPMLSTVLDQFEGASVECVLGYSRVVNDLAAIVALQTTTIGEVHRAIRGLSPSRHAAVLKRIREGRLQVRVVEGHVSHAKIYLLSDGPNGERCVLTGSANFSAAALLGDQHEVLIRFRDDRAWEHFEGQYREVRNHTSAEVDIATLLENRLDPTEEVSPDATPVLAPGRGAQVIQLAHPAESAGCADRGRRVEKLYDMVLPAMPKETQGAGQATVKLDGTLRRQFSGRISRLTRQTELANPTFSLDTTSRHATVCGSPWSLDSEEEKVRDDATALVAFWDAYREAFRGRVDKLQHDYFIFLCWMFFSPLMCTLRRRAALDGRDVIRFPRVGIVYGKSNSGKTQLVDVVGKFMLGDDFQGAIGGRLTNQTLRAIDASYRRMPAFFDDVGWRRFREHAAEYIKDETLSPHDETPCTIVSMNARAGGFPDEIAKRTLLVYSSASLPSEDEGGRIAMSDRLSLLDPSTHLYRRYLREILEHLDAGATDWLLLSSKVICGILASCGHDPAWAQPIAWEAYASTRYDVLREQLRSLLHPSRRRAAHPTPETTGWYAEGDRIWVRVGANSFGHPDFEWRDLPTYMLHEHESRSAEFVLDLPATERFLDRKLIRPRWRFPIWPPAAR